MGLAVPAGVLVFVAGPEEAAQVARDALEGVRGAASEAWSGLSSAEQSAEGALEAEGEWGWAAGRTRAHGLVCYRDENTASVVDGKEFLSKLRGQVRSRLPHGPRVEVSGLELDFALPSTLPLGSTMSAGARWYEARREGVALKEGTARFRLVFPCNYLEVVDVEGITEAVIPPPITNP